MLRFLSKTIRFNSNLNNPTTPSTFITRLKNNLNSKIRSNKNYTIFYINAILLPIPLIIFFSLLLKNKLKEKKPKLDPIDQIRPNLQENKEDNIDAKITAVLESQSIATNKTTEEIPMASNDFNQVELSPKPTSEPIFTKLENEPPLEAGNKAETASEETGKMDTKSIEQYKSELAEIWKKEEAELIRLKMLDLEQEYAKTVESKLEGITEYLREASNTLKAEKEKEVMEEKRKLKFFVEKSVAVTNERIKEIERMEGDLKQLVSLNSLSGGESEKRRVALELCAKIGEVEKCIKNDTAYRDILEDIIEKVNQIGGLKEMIKFYADDLKVGAVSLNELKKWFKRDVEKAIRQAILVGEDKRTTRHMIAYLFSIFSKHDYVYTDDKSPHGALSRTGYFLHKNNLHRALIELDSLEGLSREVSNHWSYEAKKYLELKQFLKVTKCYLQSLARENKEDL